MQTDPSNVALPNTINDCGQISPQQSFKEFSEALDVTGQNSMRQNNKQAQNKFVLKRMPTKSQLLLDQSNFHRLKAYEK